MVLKIINPKSFLNKAYLKVKPQRSEIEIFKTNLNKLLGKIDEIEREENQKIHLRDFLRDTYYKDTNEINTKDYKDLVIHLGKTNRDKVGVIVEAKRPSNYSEMISSANANCKSLHELILYYFDERENFKNNELKHLIITNVYEWFIFDANQFDKLIYRNKELKKLYEIYLNDRKDTAFFYEEASKQISNIESEFQCAYFDIRDYRKFISNDDKEDDKNLIALYKLLSPVSLLKVPFINDSNSLNQNFYKELLHIIGLEEVKSGSKNIIRRKEKDRQPGSLIENTLNILITEDSINRVKDKSIYGDNKDEQLFNIALELCLTWINRILFLKLLEGLLISYHKGNKDYCFLNVEIIPGFDELYKLFHQVLAINISDRKQNVQQKYSRVPYLNSSLFEISELENSTIKINALDDSEKIELLSSTVLKEAKRKTPKLEPLEYLFKFLDAYDFASEGGEDIAEDNKTIINASVLGKVFEKINGYKDGSIFTPGFITMYMSRQALRLAVLQKFNEYFKSNGMAEVGTFDELYNPISRINIGKANEIINSLRICDPAVGSGHFLVSVLNELIVIKSELGILIDKNGKLLKDYEIVVENDELIISDEDGIFEYIYNNKESQRIQETIFNEKQTLIENCLYGVDINPNSVQICRLRLWIELLKSSFYRPETINSSTEPELETLPNIDINIKCGNSLLSRYTLDADLKKAMQNSKWNIQSYQLAVATYRNTRSRETKKEMEKLINDIKNNFEVEIQNNDARIIKLNQWKNELLKLTTQETLFDKSKKEKEQWNKQVNKLTEDIRKQEKQIEEIRNNAIYKNAFEWRFEFPEVLNDNGDFVGFDVVIGNPPYVRQEEIQDYKLYFEKNFISFSGKSDIYVYFYEKGLKILKNNGLINYISSGKFLEASYGKTLIDFLIEESCINNIVNFHDLPVFEGVTAYPLIFLATKKMVDEFTFICYDIKELPSNSLEESLKDISPLIISKSNFIQNGKMLVNQSINVIFAKLKINSLPLEEYCGLPVVGIKTGFNEGFISKLTVSPNIKPYVFGRDIKKYQPVIPDNNIIFPYNEDYTITEFDINSEIFKELNYQKENLSKRAIIKEGIINGSKCWYEYQQINKTIDINAEYIIYPNLSFGNNFTLSKGAVIDMTGFLIKSNSKYLLSILNSKLISFLMQIWCISRRGGYLEYKVQYVEKIMIKNISQQKQQPFIDLVDVILAKKAKNEDTSQEENEIDIMVYKLYNLTYDEVKIVDPEFSMSRELYEKFEVEG